MIFVTADRCRAQLEAFTQLLVSAFPGSTIYQHTDPDRVPHDVLHNPVDAVFLTADGKQANGLELIPLLRRQKPDLPVFIISATEDHRQAAAAAGASDYLLLPVTAGQLQELIRSEKNKEHVS